MASIEVVAGKPCSLANSLAASFNQEVFIATISSFADTETVIQIKNSERIKGKIVFLVARFSLQQNRSINEQLIETLLLAHQIKACQARHIVLITPYLPYSRQSKNVTGSIMGPLQAIGFFYQQVGIEHIIVSALHEILEPEVFPVPLHEIKLERLWSAILTANFEDAIGENICFVSPDRGGFERVKAVVKVFHEKGLKVGAAYVEKRREDYDRSIAISLVGDVHDKIVVLIDDIIDTGMTAVEAAKMVLNQGAKKVFGCFAHAVFSKGALERLKNGPFEHIWITNSLAGPFDKLPAMITVVSIDNLVQEAVKTFAVYWE